ncbi:MAG: DUF6512 family protein [Eubacteriales bacterium]
MKKYQAQTPGRRVVFSVFIGFVFISLIGGMFHFIYDWSGHLTIVGIFAPVNESLWEHLKMPFFPAVIWWIGSYFVIGKKEKLSSVHWLTAAAIAPVTCLLFIMTFYYLYTGAFGIHTLFLDASSLFIGAAVGQTAALHIYRYSRLPAGFIYIAGAIILIVLASFIAFTYFPPHIPLFMDSLTGKYGLQA